MGAFMVSACVFGVILFYPMRDGRDFPKDTRSSNVTGGNRKTEVPSDKINLEFVLGKKVMVGTVNANREYFESDAKDLAQPKSLLFQEIFIC